ncbi:TPA: thioredoxin family protein [Candidatus Bathyarchaeota archaeon]|nr:thioredoxin family protein [Candidatus Bathyarchaeota archaeon]HIJ08712.1 thioredoxin family protein [Candidatus Bathyarchaeota archaeon]
MSKAERKPKEKGKTTFADEIGRKEKALVLFYATWCPYSQRFLPIFKEYSKTNPEECLSVVVDDNPEVCEEYSIEYYPTVILFRKGEAKKRLDAEPGIGLDRKQLKDFTENE